MAEEKTPWSGRFSEVPSKFAQEFGASLPFDKRLNLQDIAGSIAHAKMLANCNIISDQDCAVILDGLAKIKDEIERGLFVFDIEDEDIHMAIEKRLIALIGEAGGRLHSARSRNDQVALDVHLFTKECALAIMQKINELREVILKVAQSNVDVILPGYTHMQKAQPVLFSHHILTYFHMLSRDFNRFKQCYIASDVCPLGAGALAGTPHAIDRDFVADELGFTKLYNNSMDAVSDRDFVIDFIYAASICMMHISRLCEELIYWASSDFGYITFADEYSTGSSIMPNKKNPDFCELIRGKVGRVYGDLTAILTTMKAIPLAYNKDMQEDKEPLFDAFDTCFGSLNILAPMLDTLQINADVMRISCETGYIEATDLADYLVRKGLAFRDAHAIVGHIVGDCVEKGISLQDLSLEDLQKFSELFEVDALEVIKLENVVNSRKSYGATSYDCVKVQIDECKNQLDKDIAQIKDK
ncbi:MAG: argininosuccinate lyase [Coriobacteriales bacterium]|nr:argininosuccinate lyase [Coriobacteriales bacterium]